MALAHLFGWCKEINSTLYYHVAHANVVEDKKVSYTYLHYVSHWSIGPCTIAQCWLLETFRRLTQCTVLEMQCRKVGPCTTLSHHLSTGYKNLELEPYVVEGKAPAQPFQPMATMGTWVVVRITLIFVSYFFLPLFFSRCSKQRWKNNGEDVVKELKREVTG